MARPQVPGADGEGTLARGTARSRPGGSDAMTVRQARGEGTTTGRIKSLGGGYGVVLDSLFLLPFVHELGPPPEGWRQVRAWRGGCQYPYFGSHMVLWVNGTVCS